MGTDIDISLFEKGTLTVGTLNESEEQIVSEVEKLLMDAVKKRLPEGKFGIMFSGGIDSTLIALLCKQFGADFICYTAALSDESLEEAQDLGWAKKVAAAFGIEHRIITLTLDETEQYLKKIIPILKDPNVVNVGVGLPIYLSCLQAKKDDVDVLFTGLGSEEIFAGYERHKISSDINEECIKGLLNMPKRDFERDVAISEATGIEFRVPFLDKELVKYSLGIPGKYKVCEFKGKELSKVILRKAALNLGLREEFALRKKTAAQYGSKFDRALSKLAKRNGFEKKSDYLEHVRIHL